MLKLAIVSLLLFVAVVVSGASAGVESKTVVEDSTLDIAGETPQTPLTFQSLGYNTSTFYGGDTLVLDFDSPYEESSAILGLHKIIDAEATNSGSLDLQVASAGDDAYTSKDWSVLRSNEKILRLGNHSVGGRCSVFARFPDISGLGGATITDAYLEVLRNAGEGSASIKISAEDAESPSQITRSYDHWTRPRTAASVNWTGTLGGGWNRSPSIVPVIQELVDNYDPTAIQILLDDDASTPSGNSWELFAWEYGAHDRGIKLHIEYEAGGSSEDYAKLFINNEYITTVSFYSSGWETVEVPIGVMERGTNTIMLEFVGPNAKVVVEDSTIDIADETPQTPLTFQSLGYNTSAFYGGDSLILDFDNPYEESSAVLELHKIIDTGTTNPGSLDLQVASAGDDAYTSKDWSVLCSNEKILRLGNHSVCGRCSVFARFPDISGLGGATITDAYLEVFRNAGEGSASIKISAEDAESPSQITRSYDHWTRPRTAASVNWTGTLGGGWNRSPSIVPIIQELVDNYDPTAIQILLDDDASTPSGNSWELFAWEYGAHDRGIKLHIEYEAGGSSGDYAKLFINNEYITTVSFYSSGWETVEVPIGVMHRGTNTIKLEFVGPNAKVVVEDSTLDIAS